MTFEELQDELYARGFSYLDDDAAGRARAARWLNQAYGELCDLYDWPFLETTATGASPLALTDVRRIVHVLDTTNDLYLVPTNPNTLSRTDPDFSTATGNPDYYYLDNTTVRTYPTTSVSLSVRYFEVPTELDDDADEPLVPSRFQNLIIDGAVIKAYYDSDNADAAAALTARYDRQVAQMVNALLHRNPESVERHYAHEGM